MGRGDNVAQERSPSKVRYAVVGLGHIAQVAILPAFAHARRARALFAAEPTEVFAWSANTGEKRFREVDEMTAAVLRFPGERLATFTCSLGAADVSAYQVVGTKGSLRVDPAYGYADTLGHHLEVGGKPTERRFRKRDQFAAELLYFSDWHPRGPGAGAVGGGGAGRRAAQAIERPPVRKPRLVRAESPSPE
jgi:predicted dehydrogenase